MDIQKQREIIRLWNKMRRAEGPLAEEIRIQILESFVAEQGNSNRAVDVHQARDRVHSHSGLSAVR
jgi:hypothetical protein